jgi:hypothetical protein
MFLSYFTLFVALSLSAVAAWYSIIGLTAIFAAAVIPIIIMGGILEVAKITITVWLHEYWHRCRWLMKVYLVPAVALLMLITSMGIFGFLSKAHLDQAVPTGDVQAQVALLDEKITTQRDNIATARAAIQQMDNQVNERLARSADDRGAERAVQIRRNQARERAALQRDIAAAQAEIAQLNQQRAPVAAELRKVEAEVGPIKYIAALIYGDDPDANLLEKAVRWVIILLVIVFDPLAIMMVLAATESLKWRRETPVEPAYPPDNGPLTDEQLDQIQSTAPEPVHDPDTANALIDEIEPAVPEPVLPEKTLAEQHPYVNKGFAHFENLAPMPAPAPAPTDSAVADEPEYEHELPHIKEAIKKWKTANPDDTIKNQRHMMARGEIKELPWMALIEELPDIDPEHGFGTQLPKTGRKRDTYVRTDLVPNRVYKHNGSDWIEVDRNLNDSYTYNTAYIDHLIDKIAQGQYDPDLLSESESEQVAIRLNQKSNT